MDVYSLYIDLLVMNGGVEPFLRNVDYPSIVVFLNMLFFKYYHAHIHPIICSFKYWSWIVLII